MKFYEGFDGHNMPTVWHDPNGDGYTPVPVLTKLHVPPGYWDEVVHRLTTDDGDLIDRYNLVLAREDCALQAVNILNTENRAVHAEIRRLRGENRALHTEIRRLRDADTDVRGACGDCA